MTNNTELQTVKEALEKIMPLTLPTPGTPIAPNIGKDLMEIEQKYYDEDIAKQQQMNLNTTNKDAQKLGESEYVPKGHDKVVERELI